MSNDNWPERLKLRDTKLHDDLGGGGQRIFTIAGQGYERMEYVRADLCSVPTGGTIDGQHMGPHEAHAVGYAKGHAAGVEAARSMPSRDLEHADLIARIRGRLGQMIVTKQIEGPSEVLTFDIALCRDMLTALGSTPQDGTDA